MAINGRLDVHNINKDDRLAKDSLPLIICHRARGQNLQLPRNEASKYKDAVPHNTYRGSLTPSLLTPFMFAVRNTITERSLLPRV